MERDPSRGPRILFFSGGTALRETSRRLVRYTHRSIHLVTPFDSGGSSAHLRRAFGMPAVGDLRNRVLALAVRDGAREAVRLLGSRLPRDESPVACRRRLDAIVEGTDPAIGRVAESARESIRKHLRAFVERMPEDFELRGASIGNLVLTGGYLREGHGLSSAIDRLGAMVRALGRVRPIVEDSAELVAHLADGRRVVGQHRISGKEAPPVDSPIRRLHLTRRLDTGRRAEIDLSPEIRELIRQAELICYPIGSFWSSVVATLLPRGVGDEIVRANVPKVYVPNMGRDPEQLGMSVVDAVRTLLVYAGTDSARTEPATDRVGCVLIDERRSGFAEDELEAVERTGIRVVRANLITDESAPFVDGDLLARALVSMIPGYDPDRS